MNCDAIARWYRWLEYLGFGRALERRRNAFLHRIADARRALVVGEGDGRFLANLLPLMFATPGASVDYVDVSARMLELARSRAGDRPNYILGDALTIPLPSREYDLIVTHFFLDCFNAPDAQRVIERLSASARDDARWVVSEFRESGWFASVVIRGLYLFFRIATGLRVTRLIDHRPLLEQAGFSLQQQSGTAMLVSELWSRRAT